MQPCHDGRLLAIQISEKAKARAAADSNGGMFPQERLLNKALLRRAAVTMGMA